MLEQKLYKVIRENKSCHGGEFDWTPYLPDGDRPGKWTPTIADLSICHTGYHVTPYWNMWHEDGCEVYECEARGLVIDYNAVGVVDKHVCQSVRLVRKIDLALTGNYNTGDRNTGDWNTGHRNTGHWNTGHRNTGNYNNGSWNTGHRNTGRYNTGRYNTGHRNTGDWNTGDRNTGRFNTGRPQYVELFNKVIKREHYDTIEWPSWLYHDGDWKKAFNGASSDEIRATVALPNFDYAVFEEITGITKTMITEAIK